MGWEAMTVGSAIVAEAPARGAGLNQVIGLTIAAAVIVALMLWRVTRTAVIGSTG
ncbi:hypothetical protein I553_4012 [Mycobacterium xenopi 4042]|uniref:Uncharacterized protein n=1 Tax=Mycobacterium xenopi 4042 TaxID=1299334 RepID=X8BBD9_MYCXE|nr:hypothetical protein I553_4012 [Mycobacterium xenopi 4042]